MSRQRTVGLLNNVGRPPKSTSHTEDRPERWGGTVSPRGSTTFNKSKKSTANAVQGKRERKERKGALKKVTLKWPEFIGRAVGGVERGKKGW